MISNIEKLQTGGQVFFSAVANPYSNAAVADRTVTAASQSSKSGSEGLISKELINKLYEKGIPVDVDNFTRKLSEFERRIDIGLPISNRQIRNLQSYANQIIKQSEYLTRAENTAEKNNALSEIAVSARGYLYVPDENGSIKQIHASKFDPENQQALTVGELIEHRKFNPSEVDDSDIATTIGTNIGIDKINDYIQDIIKTVGEASNTSEAYTDLAQLFGREAAKRPTAQQQEQIQNLYSLYQTLGPDAIFKIKESSSSKNIDSAYSYIMSMLPNNIRTQLIARNVVNGGKYEDGIKYASQLIQNALIMSNDVKQSYGMEYSSSANSSTKSKKAAEKSFNQTPIEKWLDGDLNQGEFTFSDGNKNKYGLTVKGSVMASLTNDNGKHVSNLPLGEALNVSIGPYLDKDKIYVGQNKVGEGMLNNIAYSSDKVAAVYMPTDGQGNIDWVGFNAYSQAEEYIKVNNISSPQEKNEIHSQFGSYARYDANGNQIQTDGTEKFMVTYGYTIDDYAEANENKLYEELEGDAEDDAKDLVKRIYGNKDIKKLGIDGINGQRFYDDICKVPVFIKISQFANSDAYTYAGHGAYVPQRSLEQDMMTQQLSAPVQKEERILGSGDLLWN